MIKNLLKTTFVLLLCVACSTDENLTPDENVNLEVAIENYKGIFTTLDGLNRGTLDVTLAQDNLTASGALTLSTGEVVAIFTDQITDLGSSKEITFTSNELSFTLITAQEGETLEIDTATFRGLGSAIIAARNTERTPLSTVTGTYVCTMCPAPLDNMSTQTFNLMFTNAGGDSSIVSQTTLGGSSFAGVATQSGCTTVEGDNTICSLNSGTTLGVTGTGFNPSSGPVTWTGTHFFDTTTEITCSTISGNWQWAATSIGTVGGAFTSDSINDCPAELLLFEDFEDDTLDYVLIDVATGNTVQEDISEAFVSEDYFGRATVSDFDPIDNYNFTNDQGTFFAAANMDSVASLGSSFDIATINWFDIDITGFTNINVSALFAEADASNNQEDWADSNSVRIEYSFDNATWVPFFAIEADEVDMINSTPRVDTNFDGIGDGTEITAAFTQHSQSFLTAGNTTVSIRIIMEELTIDDEDIAFDNVIVTGN